MTFFELVSIEPAEARRSTQVSPVAQRGQPPSVEHVIVQTKNTGLVGILARTPICEHEMKKFFFFQNFRHAEYCFRQEENANCRTLCAKKCLTPCLNGAFFASAAGAAGFSSQNFTWMSSSADILSRLPRIQVTVAFAEIARTRGGMKSLYSFILFICINSKIPGRERHYSCPSAHFNLTVAAVPRRTVFAPE